MNNRWPMKSLDDIFAIVRGGSPRPINAFLTDDPSGVNWIMIGDTNKGEKYIYTTKKRIWKEGVSRSRTVQPGDFLLTNSMSFGRPYIIQTSGCVHDGWLVLSPRSDDVSRDFFYYLLGSDLVYREFQRKAAGVTVKNLNVDLVKKVEVPLPPLSEQKRIAEILDRAEALRAKRRAALALLDELTQSIFLDMFGDPVSNPKGWENSSLGDQLTYQRYGPRFYNEEYSENGVRIVRITDLDAFGNLNFDNMPRHDVSDEDRETFVLRPRDIIFARTGATVGKLALIKEGDPECIAGAYFINMRFSEKLNSAYVKAALASKSIQAIVWVRSQQSAQQNFSGPGLRALPMPLPPLELQDEFAARIESIEATRRVHQSGLSVNDQLFASLQHRAFRGEL